MATMATKLVTPPPAEVLKRTFDSALADLNHRTAARTPIALRNQVMKNFVSETEIQKRAVADAARALAQLWKISPRLMRNGS